MTGQVKTTWTDLDERGQPQTDEIVWVVRREAQGWRIAGMAAVMVAGEDPIPFDFENPEETIRKMDALRQSQETVDGGQAGAETPATASLPENSPAAAGDAVRR